MNVSIGLLKYEGDSLPKLFAKRQNGNLGLCSTRMNNFLLNISFKGKEMPAQRQILWWQLRAVITSAESLLFS